MSSFVDSALRSMSGNRSKQADQNVRENI